MRIVCCGCNESFAPAEFAVHMEFCGGAGGRRRLTALLAVAAEVAEAGPVFRLLRGARA